jgi:hypothetical protein
MTAKVTFKAAAENVAVPNDGHVKNMYTSPKLHYVELVTCYICVKY